MLSAPLSRLHTGLANEQSGQPWPAVILRMQVFSRWSPGRGVLTLLKIQLCLLGSLPSLLHHISALEVPLSDVSCSQAWPSRTWGLDTLILSQHGNSPSLLSRPCRGPRGTQKQTPLRGQAQEPRGLALGCWRPLDLSDEHGLPARPTGIILSLIYY